METPGGFLEPAINPANTVYAACARDETSQCTNSGQYYLENSRALMLALFIPPLTSLAFNLWQQQIAPDQLFEYVSSARSISYYWLRMVIPLALVFTTRQALHVLGLGLLLVNIVFRIFATG